MPPLSALRDRLAAMPLDRGPLRRAGLLTVLLVVLLAVTQLWRPARTRPAAASPDRQDVQAPAETHSGGGLPVGQVAALLLLGAGGLGALYLRRRPAAAPRVAELDVIESRTIGPGQSLQLVACGGEVLLLSVGADGTRLLRQWPAETFDDEADGLASVPAAAAVVLTSESLAPDPAAAPLLLAPSAASPATRPVPAEPDAVSPPPLSETPAPPVEAAPPPVAAPPTSVPRQFAAADPAAAGAPSFSAFLAEASRG